MLNRYLGNKTVLLERILRVIGAVSKPAELVCDIFSGSLAVSLALKRAGYRVAANDINLFSRFYGKAYLLNRQVPAVDLAALVPRKEVDDARSAGRSIARNLVGEPGFGFLRRPGDCKRYVELLGAIHWLSQTDSKHLPKRLQRSDISDTYAECGKRSVFVSQRGARGRRRFFTDVNAKRIDAILNQLRYWRRERLTSETAHALLVTVLLDAVEKISNTQGTYHDFPRHSYDPRALKSLHLAPPPLDGVLAGPGRHLLGEAEDSLDFIRRVPNHSALYIDPPYNFRQYTSYYFLPNLLCKYCDIDDLDDYFERIEYVRGQNMSDDYDSPFCKSSRFIDSLELLISRAKTRWVVLSYFNGKNHWSDFKEEPNGDGLERLKAFFRSRLFKPRTLKVVPIPRQNYQSYGGYKARDVHEYLILAAKSGS